MCEPSFFCANEILDNLSFIKSVPKVWRSLRLLTPACILVLEAAVSTAEATETSEGVVDNLVIIYCRDPSKGLVLRHFTHGVQRSTKIDKKNNYLQDYSDEDVIKPIINSWMR